MCQPAAGGAANQAPVESNNPIYLRVIRGLVSMSVIFFFCCVLVAGGHGVGPLLLFALPGSGADVFTCTIWGCASALAASHFLSSITIGCVTRVFSLAALWTIWLVIANSFDVFADGRDLWQLTCVTSAPFLGASLVEVVLDIAAMCGRRTWTFTIRDLMLATLAAVGACLPMVL